MPTTQQTPMTKTDELVELRAAAEIREHGSIAAAIAAVDRRIKAPELLAAERRFMRRVLGCLWHLHTIEQQ
jgi:hypothetical protein